MGIKSTSTLPRSAALDMLAELRGEAKLSNEEIGNQLDQLVQDKHDREGTTCFDNYIVVDDDSYPEKR